MKFDHLHTIQSIGPVRVHYIPPEPYEHKLQPAYTSILLLILLSVFNPLFLLFSQTRLIDNRPVTSISEALTPNMVPKTLKCTVGIQINVC